MSRKVFLSFLGLGSYSKENKSYFYNNTNYNLNGKSFESEFVQVSEIKLLEIEFDKIIILATETSSLHHFTNLKKQFTDLGILDNQILEIRVTEKMDATSQWSWFEEILNVIKLKDEITFDLTHGFRAMPIVLSTAINFLKNMKNITIDAVYYGAYKHGESETPIVDMKEFYIINEWTDAVSRLVEDADARKLAKVSQQDDNFQLPELNDSELIKAFEDLTNAIRNVEVQKVGEKANIALTLVEKHLKNASITSKLMLQAVIDKFISISVVTNIYNKDYFKLQLKIIELLLEHKLYMQAFTVMREMVVSIANYKVLSIIKELEGISNRKRKHFIKNSRRRFAEKFTAMIVVVEEKWKFDDKRFEEIMMPMYNSLKDVTPLLKTFFKELIDIRNGFDHAWTSKVMKDDIKEKGEEYLEKLKEVIEVLIYNKII